MSKKGAKRSAYRRGGKKPCKVSGCLKKYVKKVLHSNVENKEIVSFTINSAIPTVSGSSTPAFVSCVPAISQSVLHNGRIGNEVKCVKGTIKGIVSILPYNLSTNPMSSPLFIKMWLVSAKLNNTNNLANTTVGVDFFDLGGTSGAFNGNIRDLLTPINQDAWTLYATKQIKLGCSSVSASAPSAVGFYDNSPFSVPFSFNYGKHLKTKLKFNDVNSICTNRNMFVCAQAVYADGTNTAITAAEWHYSNVFHFEDA